MRSEGRVETLPELHSLALELRAAARSGDGAAMRELLRSRRRLLKCLPRFREGQGSARSGAGSAKDLLGAVLELDGESERLLRSQLASIRERLAALGRGRRGLAGYGAGRSRPAKWIDERG